MCALPVEWCTKVARLDGDPKYRDIDESDTKRKVTLLIEACGGLEQSSEVSKTEELLKNAGEEGGGGW